MSPLRWRCNRSSWVRARLQPEVVQALAEDAAEGIPLSLKGHDRKGWKRGAI